LKILQQLSEAGLVQTTIRATRHLDPANSFFMSYRDVDGPLSYWRLVGGIEVDFVVGNLSDQALATTVTTVLGSPAAGTTTRGRRR